MSLEATRSFAPTNLDDALLIRAENPDLAVLAGGTDLMVQRPDVGAVLSLGGCKELTTIEEYPDGSVRIGAMVTWSDVSKSEILPDILRECAETIGAVQIQNMGTVGGNVINASPAGDSLPVLLALDAVFCLASATETRSVRATDFFLGYRNVDMAKDELLVAIEIPDCTGLDLYYRKVGTRRAQSISKVVMSCAVGRDEAGLVTLARVAFGSVAATPVRVGSVESALIGSVLDPNAASLVHNDISPIDDIRSTGAYRSMVAERILRRWLSEI